MCSFTEIFLLVLSGLFISLMSSNFLEIIQSSINIIRYKGLLITKLFYLVTPRRYLGDSNISMSLNSHGLRVLSPGSVIFLPTSDVM